MRFKVLAMLLAASLAAGVAPAQMPAEQEIEGGLNDVVDYEELNLDTTEPLRLELESFIDAASAGRAAVVDGEDGTRALEVALEIMRQIRSSEVATLGAAGLDTARA